MSKKIGLYWFTNDLRVNDNPLLEQAAQQVDRLICLYCYPSITPFLARYAQQTQWGEAKKRFLNQTLVDLDHSLSTLGQKLWVTPLLPYQALRHLLTQVEITDIYVDAVAGSDERQAIACIHQDFSSVHIHQQALHSLLSEPQLPFALEALPSTFTQFRKQVETLSLSSAPIGYPRVLPPIEQGWQLPLMDIVTEPNHSAFTGGEQAGLTHCQNYFSSMLPSRYKETRNGLDGMDYSTKFSPWLALGAVSPKTIYAMLQRYEAVHGANDSTYWIFFELLWREYFYWYARRYGAKLFRFSGIGEKKPLTSFYAQRFLQWKHGVTPFPIVNACMRQLNQTGYMSNRGRQLVASCLVHELGLDWRYGAAYFETQLVDYDVGSNWSNWQYLAGVGADPRGSRQFNLEKQAHTYDPKGEFVAKWCGTACDKLNALENLALDSVDMVDWPIAASASLFIHHPKNKESSS
ncbi:DASH family cryptochrome [Vibrio cholerae]